MSLIPHSIVNSVTMGCDVAPTHRRKKKMRWLRALTLSHAGTRATASVSEAIDGTWMEEVKSTNKSQNLINGREGGKDNICTRRKKRTNLAFTRSISSGKRH